MSTIDEVLAAAEVVDAVCVIDGETRIISVPTEYKELGVESDEKVTRVKFQCPKIVGDNIDLTEYNLYINYRNAANKLNSYLVEDVAVTDNILNFSWLLSRHVTESPGTISYIVCAKKSDNTGVINEWNTKVATGTVGIGLEATEEIEEQNVDAIEQILRSIVELENKVDGGGSGGSGGYYAPSVDADGNLTWTPSKADMPAVDGANIKGANGKSAYQYAVEGGYTGTEAEFAAKLAEEMPDKLPNPNTLTFTGAVTGTYDGSAAVSVEIPSGGSGGEPTIIFDSGEITEEVNLIGPIDISKYSRLRILGKAYPSENSTGKKAAQLYFGDSNHRLLCNAGTGKLFGTSGNPVSFLIYLNVGANALSTFSFSGFNAGSIFNDGSYAVSSPAASSDGGCFIYSTTYDLTKMYICAQDDLTTRPWGVGTRIMVIGDD